MKKMFIMIGVCSILLQAGETTQNHLYSAAKKNLVIDKAQRFFRKKLQRKYGFTAAYFAEQHTSSEWEDIHASHDFTKEFNTLCPKGTAILTDKWKEPLYLFSVKYGRNSGERPRC